MWGRWGGGAGAGLGNGGGGDDPPCQTDTYAQAWPNWLRPRDPGKRGTAASIAFCFALFLLGNEPAFRIPGIDWYNSRTYA